MRLASSASCLALTLGAFGLFASSASLARADAMPENNLGASCFASNDCTSEICAGPSQGAAAVCTQACGEPGVSDPCPSGFACMSGYCYASSSSGSGSGGGSGSSSSGPHYGPNCSAFATCCATLRSSSPQQGDCKVLSSLSESSCEEYLLISQDEGDCESMSTSGYGAPVRPPAPTDNGTSMGPTGCTTSPAGSTAIDLVLFAGALGIIARARRRKKS
jgi:hypothetical protein